MATNFSSLGQLPLQSTNFITSVENELPPITLVHFRYFAGKLS